MREGEPSELGKDLGRRLAILRESRNLSKAELARKAKISSSSLSLYESGAKIPELATLFRILEALDYGFGAIDRADEFCLAVRLTPGCRPPLGIADPLRTQIVSLALEAGSALSRLTDGVALLAGQEPMSERVRAAAAAEGHPLPEDRVRAVMLWERIRKYPHGGRSALIAELPESHTWAFSELLAHESAEAASDSAALALELAQEALQVAELMPGDEARRARSRGYARGHLGNAERVQGDIDTASHSFTLSDEEWKAGEGCAGDLLDEARLLHLKASLRTTHLAPIFRANGVHREAIAALTLFRRAAEQEEITLDLAERLVAFLRKAQHDPELKFEEPPSGGR